ncbi:hypothetical protein CPC08DRAFT_677297 [Agrocybe pediades]|nr:hypothetical protein CPC08DRAFT_677297 [Agrocybe pediades]
MSNNRSPPPPPVTRHISAASIDTNASGIAESTISLGLGRFPEPPSSIPSTPIRSNFGNNSPSRSTFGQSSLPAISALRRVLPQPQPSEVATHSPLSSNQSPSFDPLNPHLSASDPLTRPTTSTNTTSIDWHNAASNLAVDAAEDRLLPTSFITTLLQQNKELRRQRRTSHGSDAFSGISEMTYPPPMSQYEPRANISNLVPAGSSHRHTPGRALPSPPQYKPQESRPPPSAFPQNSKVANRMSGDSETLHSAQGHSAIVRGPDSSRMRDPSVVGIASAMLYGYSGSSQISSTQDSDTIRSMDKGGYQNKLSPTYESGDELDYKGHKIDPDFTTSPATDAHRRFLRENASRDPTASRNSLHSTRSTSASFMSRISGLSLRRIIPWRRVKPLPPVPLIPNISVAAENAHRKADDSTPLPELVNRAGLLQVMLDNGQHPYNSLHDRHDIPNPVGMTYEEYEAEVKKEGFTSPLASTMSKPMSFHPSPRGPYASPRNAPSRKKRCIILLSFIVIAVLAAIGAGVGATLGRKKTGPQFDCKGNFTGAGCSLDTTCVCTSSTNCNGLAQAIIHLIPVMNREFGTNMTEASTYSNIWLMQGSPSTSDCAAQALLLDVGPGINQLTAPNRTQWARSAMLWNAVQTQDIDVTQKMTQFVQSLPWDTLSSTDGPTTAGAPFTTTVAGFTYDYAAQTITQPPASFATLGQPSSEQISRVSSTAQTALDRMYTYAQASSLQQQTALKKYWVSVLLQRPADLPTFTGVLSAAPILLPFNASSKTIRNLYVSSPSSSFPPPLSCFPGLSSSLTQRIASLESTVFGLQPAASAGQFDPTCYRDRPVYGTLDVLNLRLPSVDGRTGTDKQAAILSHKASSRVVLYQGDLLSGIDVSSTSGGTLSSTQIDPRQYGTLSFSDHVVLRYLQSFPNVTLATAFIDFILNTATKLNVPPDVSSTLFQSLQSIPILEVAVFGDIPPSDLTSTVSPFTNPSGTLFFGSDDGAAMRNWTINTIAGPVIWTENATSPVVARDTSVAESDTITLTWNAISLAISHNIAGIGLANITSTLERTNRFAP